MCGRYAASKSTDELVEEFDVAADHTAEPIRSLLKNPQQPPLGEPDFNIAPTKAARVVLERRPRTDQLSANDEGGPDQPPQVRQLRLLSWGLVPSWAKGPAGAARMANARAEAVLEKPAFRRAVRSRRCLVPATGWYEWQPSPLVEDRPGRPRTQPFFIHRRDHDSLALAGLYEFWRDPQLPAEDPLAWLATFAIITTSAEDGLERIHDRQPLVLDADQWSSWLDSDTDVDQVAALLAMSRPGRFDAYPVHRAVGNSRSNGPAMLQPVAVAPEDGVIDPWTAQVLG